MASIEQRSNGNWMIKVYLGRDENGKTLFKRKTYIPKAKTPKAIEKEVKAYADQFEKEVKEGKYYDGEEVSFRDFVETWEKEWASQHLTPSIQQHYMSILKSRVLNKPIANRKLSRISAIHIQEILNEEIREGKAPKTVKYTYTCIHSVMKYAFKMNVIKEDPCLRCDLPSVKKNNDIHFFSIDQARAFLDFISNPYEMSISGHNRTNNSGTTYHIGDYKESRTIPTQLRVYYTMAIQCGMRRGELIALTWNDIDFKNKTVNIDKAVAAIKDGVVIKDPKTASGIRVLTIPDQSLFLLQSWKIEQTELMWKLGNKWEGKTGTDFGDNNIFIQMDSGKMMSMYTPYQRFKSIIDLYNSQCDDPKDYLPDIRLHDLRHTCASLLIAEGTDVLTVANRLGHRDPSVTLNVYGHAQQSADRKASDTISRLFA